MSRKKIATYVTTGIALEAVSLLGLAYATDTHLAGISPVAAVSIFIDGTKDIIPTDDPQGADRMKEALASAYDQGYAYDSDLAGGNIYIDYPRDFGLATGLDSYGYDESRTIGRDKTIAAIKQAMLDFEQQDGGYNPEEDKIYVVGFSQGANAQSDVIDALRAEGYDASNITFVMVGQGARNNGGLWARLPAGVYVPFIGLSFGQSTNPVPEDDPYYDKAPNVLILTKQYDGAADVPNYLLAPGSGLAVANSLLAMVYVHNGYYQDVDPDFNGDGAVDDKDVAYAEEHPETYIVTKNGNVTDVVIRNQPGDLPLTRPLLDLGVPREVVEALDPFLRSMIDTAYERPTDGVYSAEPVYFGLTPPPSNLVSDAHSIVAGWQLTNEKLAAINYANLAQSSLQGALAPQGDPEDTGLTGARLSQEGEQTVTSGTEGQGAGIINPLNVTQQGNQFADLPQAPPASTPAPPPPSTPPPPPPAAEGLNVVDEEEEEEEEEQPVVEDDDEIIVPTGTSGTPNKFSPPKAGVNGWKPGALLKKTAGAIKSAVGALTGATPVKSTAPASPPAPDPEPGPEPSADEPSASEGS